MSSSTVEPAPRNRPVFVTILFWLFWVFGVPVWLWAIGLTIFGQHAGRSLVAMGLISLVVLVLRAAGMVKLFLMKADAWIALTIALVIEMPVVAIFFFRDRTDGVDLTFELLNTAVGWAIAVGVIVYAYRVTNTAEGGKKVRIVA